ncbi:MAG: 4-hydroxybenzoate octaprenyltransferase [Nitrospirae bacterium]|nr:4-hydroxybenzoate octaprenyltransferase [Nitrospirota bacterium]
MNPFLKKIGAYLRLMRVDRPIGTVLVLMPTLWSLWIASQGRPSLLLVVIFTLGSFLMRSAGCVINDIADRNFDPYVTRTRERPIASGEITVKEGLVLFLVLAALSFLLILPLNRLTILLAFAGLFLAIGYPFTKRFISFPQFILGMSFGWGVILAWAAVKNKIELPAILLFIANIFWSLAYDTIYALMDREDDIKIGVKSTAILFGDRVWLATAFFLFCVLFFLGWTGWVAGLHFIYFSMIILMGFAFFIQTLTLKRNPSSDILFRLFKNHGLFGFLIFIGIVTDYFFY